MSVILNRVLVNKIYNELKLLDLYKDRIDFYIGTFRLLVDPHWFFTAVAG